METRPDHELWEELLQLRQEAAERDSIEALRQRLIEALRQADAKTVKRVAELLQIS